jgi:hypothetical protein
MKFSKLKSITKLFIGAVIVSTFAISCGNDTNEGKSSTSDSTGAASADTSMANTTTAKAGKKTGKASITMPASTNDNSNMTADKMGYYNRTEVAPMFAVGQSSLEDYINNNSE